MSYPFANNQYAQSSSHSYDNSYRDSFSHSGPAPLDPHSSSLAPTHNPDHDILEYSERPENRGSYYNHGGSINPIAPYGSYANRSPEDEFYPSPAAHEKELVIDHGNVGSTLPYEKSTDMLNTNPYRGNSIWTADQKRVMGKRSVPVKVLRVSFCVIINTIIVIISIICLVIIFARPPMIGIGDINPPNASSVGVTGTTLTLNGSVNFVFSNPNSISATLTSLKADIYDKVDTGQAIGSGTIKDAKIPPHTNTTITFPYQIKYNPAQDPNKTILKDLSSKCGGNGGASQDLNLSLKINARLDILSVPIPIAFKQDISFTCPISSDVLNSLGVNGLSGSLNGRSHNLDGSWFNYLSDRQEL